MATTAEVSARIERSLHGLEAEADFLPTWMEWWDELPEGERVSQSLDWEHLLVDYLGELDEWFRDGKMTEEQRSRYRDLRARLEELRPHFERMELAPILDHTIPLD